ncbi:hypothetical protein EAI28_07975 [Faecalicatena contorta]|nr:hypothetical protein [Faecalicatena contorta]
MAAPILISGTYIQIPHPGEAYSNSAQRPSSKYFLFSDRLPSYLYVIIGVTIFCKLTILEKDADYENQ